MTTHRLRNVLALQPLLAILLPGIAVLCGIFWIEPQIQLEVEARQQQLVRAVGMQVEGYLNSGAAMIRAAAAIKSEQDRQERQHQAEKHRHQYHLQLDALLDSSQAISSIYVVAEDGKVVDVALRKEMKTYRGELTGLDLSNNPLFIELEKTGQSQWSKTFLSIIDGGLVTAYGVRAGATTLIGEIDLGFLTQFLQQQTGAESDLLILVVDHYGQVVADNNGQYTAQQLNIANIPLVQKGFGADRLLTGHLEFSGVNMTGSISPLPSIDWHVLVAKDNVSLYRTVMDIAIMVLGGVLGALFLGTLFSFVLAEKLASRFQQLASHAQSIAQGEGSGEWPTTSIDEFNRLSDNLQRMARRLQDSELLYRTLFEKLPDGVILWNMAAETPLQFNSAAHQGLGYSRDEFAALKVRDFLVVDSDRELSRYQEQLVEKGWLDIESVHRAKGGELRDVLVTLQILELAEQRLILALHRDITESKKALREIKNINDLLSIFVQHSPIYTFIKEVSEQESRVLLASENYQEMIGIPGSQMAGKTMAELFPAELAANMTADDWRVVSAGETLEVEEELNGRIYTSIKFPIVQKERTLLAGYTIDITERKQAEEERINLEKQLLHVQKLESLGVLAGGIAHDFNNILLAITGNADMAIRRAGKGNSPLEHLQRIKLAAENAADLATQMLAYSGKGKFKVEALNLNLLLEEMLHMLEISISKTAVLKMNLHQPLPAIEADATQMRQIIMNLVINASEAIGNQTGEITVTTSTGRCRSSDFIHLQRDEDAPHGECVCLEVADTGCGMDKETLEKLFDPFFTTKFTGRGLGMAAVQGIVRGHHGSIRVESEPGRGSCFKVFLPASEQAPLVDEEVVAYCLWRGGGTVLLVDDEEGVRKIGSEMLRELGFAVLTANDGKDALEVYKQHPEVDFVVLDMTMPQMDGEKCFYELRKLNPELKVIMSSGYSELQNTKKLLESGLAGFIQKPYWLDTLREALRTLAE